MTTHNLSATVTDPLAADDTDTLAYTSTASAAPRVVTRSLLANRINWDFVVGVTTQGPTFSDDTPPSTSETNGVACPPGAITVTQIFNVSIPVRFTGCRIYKAPNATGTNIDVVLWSGVTTGTVEGSEQIASWVADGGCWYQVDFATPVDLVPDVTYTLGFHSQDGIYAYTNWVWYAQDTVVWPMYSRGLFESSGSATHGNTSGGDGVGTITFPPAPPLGRHTATAYYIDVQVEWDDVMPGYTGGTGYLQQWTNPLSLHAFPVAVYFADPPYLADYYALGINTLIGGTLTNPDYIAAMDAFSNVMDWYPYPGAPPHGAAFVLDEEPAAAAQVRGWQLDDEPDMSSNPVRLPSMLREWVNYTRVRDSTRPMWLGMGKWPALNQGFGWAPQGASVYLANDLWREWAALADIISCDFYTLVNDPNNRYGIWAYAAQVGRLREITDDTKPVWLTIETTQQPGVNSDIEPTPDQVQRAVWAALIAGARGIVFFDHRFPSDFVTLDFAAMLSNAPMSAMVTALTARLQALGPALLAPDAGLVTAYTSSNTTSGPKGGTFGVPLHYTTRVVTAGTDEYCFVQAIRPGATTATITIPTWAGETVTVIDESRSEVVSGGGVITDSFAADYQFHLYHRTEEPIMSLLAVDDGIWSGNLNLADVFFLIAVILAVISALAHYRPTSAGHALAALSAAVAAVALGLLVL